MKRSAGCLSTWIAILILALSARAEDGVTPDRIVLGTSAAQTGPVKVYGDEMQIGAKAFFDRFNKSGGAHGRKVDIVYLDDGYQPERAFENTKKFVEEIKVFSMFGYVGTPTTAAIMPYVKKSEVPFLFPYTGGDFLRTPVVKNIFNTRVSYSDETYELTKYAVKELGIKDFGVFFQDDAYGTAGKTGIDRALGEAGLRSKVLGSYIRNTDNLDIALEEIMKVKPKAVFLVAVKKTAVNFIKKAAEKGYKPIYLAPSPVGTLDLIEAIGKEADNVYLAEVLPFPTDTSFQIVRDYQRDMKEIGQTRFSHITLEGYFNSAVTAEALKRAGKDLTRAKLTSAFEGMKGVDIGGIKVSFSGSQHQGLSQIFLVNIKAGQATPVKQLK